jgi:DegV family protein with EDD domain
MTGKEKQFSLLCPFCKDVISFSVSEDEIEKKYKGGLAEFTLDAHGMPKHSLSVYIDKNGMIRGAYPNIEQVIKREDLQCSYVIDATCELTPKEGQYLGIDVLPFFVVAEGEKEKAYGQEIFFPEIFRKIKNGKVVHSEPVPVKAFYDSFDKLPRDKPVLAILTGSNYSKDLENAVSAMKIIRKKEPEFAKKIHIIDSQVAGPLLKKMILDSIEMDREGKSYQEIIAFNNKISKSHRSLIFVETLEYIRRSNRIGKVAGFFGNLLGLKPILIENEDGKGEIGSYKNVRNKTIAYEEMVKAAKKEFGDNKLAGVFFHGVSIDDAIKLRELFVEHLGINKDDFAMEFVGTGIGMHLGFEMMGLSLYPID